MRHLLIRILSDDPLIRAMSYQSVLSAFGEGTFLTGSAVFFTQIVGLSAAQVGLGMTIAMACQFLLSVPLGRLADRVGTKRTWVYGSVLELALFLCWPLAADFAEYVAVTVAMELVESWMRAGRNAYRFQVFPREKRVSSNAYMRAARNVGYTLGAAAGGVALGFGNDAVIRAIPLFSAAVLVVNVLMILPLPTIGGSGGAGEPAMEQAVEHAGERRSALHNRGFVVMSFFDGILETHQVLLNTVIPLWLVQETDAPRVLLAWLFGTNTVMAVLLQVAAARGVTDVRSALGAQRRGAICMLVSCVIVAITHDTTGAVTIGLVWLGHLTVTGAELFQSAGEWGLQAELSDPARMGEYQGAAQLGSTLGYVWAPAAYTYLAMEWHDLGWVLIAAIIVVAAIGIQPSARAAERYLARTTQPTPV
jgi:MFS family permease